MKLVIDASAAVKWLVAEHRDHIARDVLRDGFAVFLTDDAKLHQKAMTLGAKLKAILLINWKPGLPVSPGG